MIAPEVPMSETARRRVSFLDYAQAEASSLHKHEWLDGQVVAMAGGTPLHAQLTAQVSHLLRSALRGGPCRVYSSDLMVKVPDGLATYPDVSVICGPLEAPPSWPHATANPRLLVEVLSPSTAQWDRGDKFLHVQRLPSLQTYVLVNQEVRRVEWFQRQADGAWTWRSAGPGQVALLEDLGISLAVDEVYEDTDVADELTGPLLVKERQQAGWGA